MPIVAGANRLLPTPSRDDAVTDPSLPHTVNSAGGTCTRLFTAFNGALTPPLSTSAEFEIFIHRSPHLHVPIFKPEQQTTSFKAGKVLSI